MIDENFYQKKVDELKRSLQSKTVFINESFSGGLFRTSAKDNLNTLSIYHMLRGLEIDTDTETYEILSIALPKSATLFNEKVAETETAEKIIFNQLDYIVELTTNMENQLASLFELIRKQNTGEKIEDPTILSDTLYKKIIPILKDSKLDFGTIKKSIKAIQVSEALTQQKMFQNFIGFLKDEIKKNKTGLKGTVYNEIDNMNLKSLEPSSFKTNNINYLLVEPDIKSGLIGDNVIQRISLFLEKVIISMGLSDLKYISYKNNAYDYLKDVITSMTTYAGIKPVVTPSIIEEYKDVINKIGDILITPEIEKMTTIYSKTITIPSIQSLYISLLSSMVLKLINYNYEEIEKQEIAQKQNKENTVISEKSRSTYVNIINTFDQLKESGFFENTKVFYETKKYTMKEKEMIKLLKMLFFKMGLIKDFPAGYLERGTFDADILGNAVRKFQASLKISRQGIKVDGRIGKNTRLALNASVELLKQKIGVDSKVGENKKTIVGNKAKSPKQSVSVKNQQQSVPVETQQSKANSNYSGGGSMPNDIKSMKIKTSPSDATSVSLN
jgi:hypothetical protein